MQKSRYYLPEISVNNRFFIRFLSGIFLTEFRGTVQNGDC